MNLRVYRMDASERLNPVSTAYTAPNWCASTWFARWRVNSVVTLPCRPPAGSRTASTPFTSSIRFSGMRTCSKSSAVMRDMFGTYAWSAGMAIRMLLDRVNERSTGYDVEMGHHAGRVMLEDVAVIHPAPGPIIRLPSDAHGCTGWHVHDVLPRAPRRRLTVHGQDLKEKAVQMEGMVHQGRIDDVPYLQLARFHRLVPMVGFLVDHEIHDVPQARLDTELDRARGRHRRCSERGDRAEALRNHGR